MVAELITKNEEIFDQFIRAGLIDPKHKRDLEIWNEYQSLPEGKPVMQRYYMIAIRHNLSTKTVRRAVNFYSENQ